MGKDSGVVGKKRPRINIGYEEDDDNLEYEYEDEVKPKKKEMIKSSAPSKANGSAASNNPNKRARTGSK